MVLRQLVAHHGGGMHGQRLWTCGGHTASCSSWRRRAREKLVDLWWSDNQLLIMEACTGKDWWTCGGQTASCSSWKGQTRAKTGGHVVVRQQIAHHGGGVTGQRLVDLWWSDS